VNQKAALFLGGATIVGGFAIGRAAVQHARDTKAGKAGPLVPVDVAPDKVQDVVSFLIGMTLIGYAIYQTPKLLSEWNTQLASLVE
jgi:hypothetical protein